MEENDRTEKRTSRILYLAAVIPAVLAVLGFFGLNTFSDVRNAMFGSAKQESSQEVSSETTVPESDAEVFAPADSSDQTLLVNRTIAESSGAETVFHAKDALGRNCDEALKLSDWGSTSYATYYIGGEFSRFTGTVTAAEDTDESVPSYLFYVAVNNDPDQKVFTAEMTRAQKPVQLDIDVSGCDYITFVSRMPESGIIYTSGVLITEGRFE